MNKTYPRCLSTTLAALLLLFCLSLSALAEEPACPINPPPAFGQFPIQWQLFSGEAVDYQVTLQVDEETGLRTYTIPNPLDWGMDASALGTWEYRAAADGTDTPEGWVQTDATGDEVQLLLSDAVYAEEGFPQWTVPCTGGADSLTLNAYLGQVRQLYAYVEYRFGEDTITLSARDHAFAIDCLKSDDGQGNSLRTYSSYDPLGVLAYAYYSHMHADGGFTSFNVEADTRQKTYRLYDASYLDAQGNSYYWQDGQWRNTQHESVDAPQGISLEELPFSVTGQWAGVPFEEPGHKPSGTFSASSLPADPSLTASDYHPWPEEENALYLRWEDAGPLPPLPTVSWDTLEDGTTVYTVTGLDKWGVQAANIGTWRRSDGANLWHHDSESASGQLTLICPGTEPNDLIQWETQTTQPGEYLRLSLYRATLGQELRLTQPDGSYWQMDNGGNSSFSISLGDRRTVEAFYTDYTLLEYSIHTQDELGNRLSQATYFPTEDESTFELRRFFHYSPEMDYQEALWLKDIGWYSYLTGEPCEGPEGVSLSDYPPLVIK